MKKLLFFLSLSSPCLAVGPLIGTVQISTNPLSTQSGGFNVQKGTVSLELSIPYVSGVQCLHTTTAGQVVGTGSDCGSGGGGGGSTGTLVNVATQYASTYYSAPGSSNTLSGLSPGTAGQILSTQGGAGPPQWINNLGATSIQNQSTLQSGATAYPSFLYVGSSASILGPFTDMSETVTFGLTAGSVTIPALGANQCLQTNGTSQIITTGSGCFVAGNFILSTSTLQSGATFYVSSGTVAGPLAVSSLTVSGANVILSTSILQSGATFYVSSGTVVNLFSSSGTFSLITASSISISKPINVGDINGNVGLGPNVLTNNVSVNNTATGFNSLNANTTGHDNTTDGQQTLFANTTGYENVAIGARSMLRNTGGHDNVAIGLNSGSNNILGNNNIFIGSGADQGGSDVSNSVAIGLNTQVTASNTMLLGPPGSPNSLTVIMSTFTASSGTATTFNTTSIKFADGTIQVSSPSGSTALISSGVAFGSASNTVTQDTNTFRWDNTNKELFIRSDAQPDGALRLDNETAGIYNNVIEFCQTPNCSPVSYIGYSDVTNPFGDTINGGIGIFDGSTIEYARFSGQSLTFRNLSKNQFVKTNSTRTLVSYDLFGGMNVWTGGNTYQSSSTFTGAVIVSTSIDASGTGTSGQFLQSQGPGQPVKWGTAAGGGASPLAISLGTSGSPSPIISSPTAIINFDNRTTSGTLQGGGTYFFTLNPSSVTLQGPIVSSITLGAMYGAPTLTGTNFTSIPGSQLTGTIPSGVLPSTVAFLSSTQTWTAQQTYNNTVVISTTIGLSGLGTTGAAGQVLTSQGQFSNPTWTTPSGGGASALAVTTGTSAGFSTVASSPTAVINFNNARFSSQLTGAATNFVDLLSTQTFSSMTITNNFNLNGSSAGAINLTSGLAAGAPISTPGHAIFWGDSSSNSLSATFGGSPSTYTIVTSSWTPVANQYLFWVGGGTNSWIVGSTAAVPSGVTSVTGTSPINSSGGTTPAISFSSVVAQAETFSGSSTTVQGASGLNVTFGVVASSITISSYTTLNGVNYAWPSSGTIGGFLQYQSSNVVQWGTPTGGGGGTVTSVTGTPPINSSGGTTPAISLSTVVAQAETFSGSSVTVQGASGLTVTFGLIGATQTMTAFNATASSVTITGGGGLNVAQGLLTSTAAVFSTTPTANALVVQTTNNVTGFSVSNSSVTPGDFMLAISSVPGLTSGTTIFAMDTYGHFISSGSTPTVSSCGTLPTMDTNSTDFQGIINTGSGSPTACTLTFANPFKNPPVCVVTDDLQTAEPAITSRSASAITITLGAALNSGHLFYICVGSKG